MKIYFILIIIIKLIDSIQFNQLCTFSYGTCNWNIGRRWHIISLDNENKVLVADAESKEDKLNGFTDTIMSSWLHLSSLCSYNVRLTFQYSIQNEYDIIDIYLMEKNRTRVTSIGQWKSIINNNNSLENNYSIWQQANITFKVTEEFRIDIEIRHLPNKKNNSIVWFGIDDIFIDNCPILIVNTTTTTEITTTKSILSITKFYTNESNSTLINIPKLKIENLPDEHPSSSPSQTLLTLIIYLLFTLIALTLLIILFLIIIFTYCKHCCPSSSSQILNHQHRLNKIKQKNRIGIQIENIDPNKQIINAIDTTVRPCFE